MTRFAFKEAAFVLPLFMLNFLFLITSDAIDNLPYPFNLPYTYFMVKLAAKLGMRMQTFYDLLSLGSLILAFILLYRTHLKKGSRRAILTTSQLLSVSLLPLGVEIYLFDPGEWNLHVTQLQADFNFLAWFSNADLFFLSLSIFLATTFILNLQRLRGSRFSARRGDYHFPPNAEILESDKEGGFEADGTTLLPAIGAKPRLWTVEVLR